MCTVVHNSAEFPERGSRRRVRIHGHPLAFKAGRSRVRGEQDSPGGTNPGTKPLLGVLFASHSGFARYERVDAEQLQPYLV
jgi:hypothetical protein